MFDTGTRYKKRDPRKKEANILENKRSEDVPNANAGDKIAFLVNKDET